MSISPTVLILGSGRVAGPAIGQLMGRGIPLVIATDDTARAEKLVETARRHGASGAPARVQGWSAADTESLGELLADAGVAISLLPPSRHVAVAEQCVDARVHLVTTSYASPEMQALHERAAARGVVLLNEMGLDPGIDHVSAMALIASERARGNRVVAFRSECGGLPAERDANPWAYKLSWSPLGVLQAARQSARFRQAGALVRLTPREVCTHARAVEVEQIGTLESLANRDATPYEQLYGLEGIPTLYRATLRYPGWAETIAALHEMNLLSEDIPAASTWTELIGERLPGSGALAERARGRGIAAGAVDRLQWLGLFDAISLDGRSVIEALADRMLESMSYRPGERDLVVLRNQIEVADPQGRVRRVTASLVVRGEANGESAMAKTVGIPAALAAELVLSRPSLAETLAGVCLPVEPQIYEPLHAELEKHGLGLSITES